VILKAVAQDDKQRSAVKSVATNKTLEMQHQDILKVHAEKRMRIPLACACLVVVS
jgi:hypothetical protein